MVVIYVRVSYLCSVISNISRMRNAINSAQLNKSGVITAAGKQMHVLSRNGDQFLLFHGMNGTKGNVLRSAISNDSAFMTYEMWYVFKMQRHCSCKEECERRIERRYEKVL